MLIVRDVFEAKYGKGGELVALFQEAREKWPTYADQRILTDAGGRFFTVVTETEVESLAAWEHAIADVFSHPDFGPWFARMEPLVEQGRREYWNVAS